MIHAYVSILNPHIHLWLTEGTALYLTNGEPFNKSYLNAPDLPSYTDLETYNPIEFSNIGGYSLAHTYIEYMVKSYGWDKVLKLIKTEDYYSTFGVSRKVIYAKWIEYIKNYDQ